MKFITRKLTIDIDDSLMSYIPKELQRRIKNRTWESREISMIKHISADSTVLDLGGCIGIFSAALNRNLSNKNNHVVLEANADLIPVLEQVKRDNNCGYHVLNSMLAMTNGEQKFYRDLNFALSGSTKQRSKNFKESTVSKITLQDIESKYNMTFDTICMDIEGGEYTLFEEGFFAADNIKNIKMLIIEMHPNNFATTKQKTGLADSLKKHLSSIFTLRNATGAIYLYVKK